MRIVEIKDEQITVEMDRWDAMRLAATLMRGRDDDYTFAVTSASLLESASLVCDYQADGHVRREDVTLSEFRRSIEKDWSVVKTPKVLPVAS